jgi:hypothetical protein
MYYSNPIAFLSTQSMREYNSPILINIKIVVDIFKIIEYFG